METYRQVLRWAIPGWLYFIYLALFVLFGLGVEEGFPAIHTVLSQPLSSMTTTQALLKDAMPGLAVAASIIGVPAGFLLYQFYFFTYWRGRSFRADQA